jgi:hypothetical protein
VRDSSIKLDPEPSLRDGIPTQGQIDWRTERLNARFYRLKRQRRHTNLTGDMEERARLDREIEAVFDELWKPEQISMFELDDSLGT